MYSTVNNATILVSTPNQTLGDIECTAGTVSTTVISAEKTIRNVENICITKAEVDEVGCSISWKSWCFHAGCKWTDSSSYEADIGKSLLSLGDGGCSSVKKWRERGEGLPSLPSSIVDAVAIRQHTTYSETEYNCKCSHGGFFFCAIYIRHAIYVT
jgi:hypothetical protein